MKETDLIKIDMVRSDLRWLLILLGHAAHSAPLDPDLERIRNILKNAMNGIKK